MGDITLETMNDYRNRIKELEEENGRLKQNAMEDMRVQTNLELEVKKLSKQIATNGGYKPEYVDKLKEKNQIYSNALCEEKGKNSKLKEKYDDMFSKACEYKNRVTDLENKIAHLEFDIKIWKDLKDKLEGRIRFLSNRIDELEKCNLNLQEWLDNKEKVNKNLREEIGRLVMKE